MRTWRVIILLVLSQVVMSANATEEPAWTLLSTIGEVEVRRYEPVVQARTPAPASASSSAGFRTLAGYIFGGNAQAQDIAMTAPVERSLSESNNYMAFYMPGQYAIDSLPQPDDSNVTLHSVPGRVVAVITFSGWARESVVREKVQVLEETLSAQGVETRSEPLLARYDPPWTPPWSRRNEVMVEVQGTPAQQWRLQH